MNSSGIIICLFVFLIPIIKAQDAPGWKYVSNRGGDKIAWADTENGYIANSVGSSYYTQDGGNTWNHITGVGFIYNVAAPSTNHVILMTLTDVYVSFNGSSFTSKETSGRSYFKDIFFLDDDNGWVVGTSGILSSTYNGGSNWNKVYLGQVHFITAVAFSSASNGCIGTDEGQILYTTTGGGYNWTEATLPGSITSSYTVTALRYRNTNEIVASLYSSVGSASAILHSADAGQTWSLVHSAIAENIYDIDFRNADTAFAIGDLLPPRNTNGSALIYQSNDGGLTWDQLSFGQGNYDHLRDISFLNPNFGWIIGSYGLYKYEREIDTTHTTTSTVLGTGFADSGNVRIFPVPAVNSINISIDGEGYYSYEIVNMTGRTMKSGDRKNSLNLDMSSFPSGVYFVKIMSNGGQVVKKIYKK